MSRYSILHKALEESEGKGVKLQKLAGVFPELAQYNQLQGSRKSLLWIHEDGVVLSMPQLSYDVLQQTRIFPDQVEGADSQNQGLIWDSLKSQSSQMLRIEASSNCYYVKSSSASTLQSRSYWLIELSDLPNGVEMWLPTEKVKASSALILTLQGKIEYKEPITGALFQRNYSLFTFNTTIVVLGLLLLAAEALLLWAMVYLSDWHRRAFTDPFIHLVSNQSIPLKNELDLLQGLQPFESFMNEAISRYRYAEAMAMAFVRLRRYEGEVFVEHCYMSALAPEIFKEAKRGLFLDLFDESDHWRLNTLFEQSNTLNIPIQFVAKLFDKPQSYWELRLEPRYWRGETVWEGILFDVSDRKLFEQALIEEKTFIEELFELSGALFCVVDIQGRILRYNPIFMETLDLNRELIQQESLWHAILSEQDYHFLIDKINQVYQFDHTCTVQNSVLTHQGDKRLIDWVLVAYPNNDEQMVIMTGVDVTSQYTLNESLISINKSLMLKNEEIEVIIRKQKVIFEFFETLRESHTPQMIFGVLNQYVKQLFSFRNMFFFIKESKDESGFYSFDSNQDFEERDKHLYFIEYKGILGKVALNHTPYYSGNCKADPDYIEHHPAVHSLMLLPIMYQDFLWGIVGVDSEAYDAFTSMDIDLMKLCAAHLGLFIEDLHSKRELLDESKKLKGLHHTVNDMIYQRQRKSIADIVVNESLVPHMAIYDSKDDALVCLSESTPSAQSLYGAAHMIALIEDAFHAADTKRAFIKSQNLYHFCQPIAHREEIMGVIYCMTNRRLTAQELEVLAILGKQMAVLWQLNQVMDQVEREALIDPLTEIWNRRYILRRIEEEHIRIQRYPTSVSLVMIDLNEFKFVNDTYGHLVGDDVLKGVAQVLKTCIRECDDIGRFGGDEFIVLLPNTDRAAAEECVIRMERQLRSSRFTEYGLTISADFGVVSVPENAENLMVGIRYADLKMYANKELSKRKQTTT